MKYWSSIKKYWHQGVLMSVLLLITHNVELLAASPKSPPNTVAFSEKSPKYKRKMLPSGRYEQETYAFSMGNLIDKSKEDASLTKLSFHEIGSILAEALLEADYVPTPDLNKTDLLVVVSWGKSTQGHTGMGDHATDAVALSMDTLSGLDEAFSNNDGTDTVLSVLENEYKAELDNSRSLLEMADQARDNTHSHNAILLGYDQELRRATEMNNSFTAVFSNKEELLTDLESPRYFVVLQVYDFQKLWWEKKRELLWTSRFSIRAQHRKFDEELWSMAMASSREFGKASTRLRRNLQPARVEFGELEYLGVESKD